MVCAHHMCMCAGCSAMHPLAVCTPASGGAPRLSGTLSLRRRSSSTAVKDHSDHARRHPHSLSRKASQVLSQAPNSQVQERQRSARAPVLTSHGVAQHAQRAESAVPAARAGRRPSAAVLREAMQAAADAAQQLSGVVASCLQSWNIMFPS
jgi:hypothetical protein